MKPVLHLIADTSAADTGTDAGTGTGTHTAADLLIATCLAAAERGDTSALFDMGVALSTGSHDMPVDLIEAHKWFNIAAARGHEDAALCRADLSDEMTAREVAEAQRRAREWLRLTQRKAA